MEKKTARKLPIFFQAAAIGSSGLDFTFAGEVDGRNRRKSGLSGLLQGGLRALVLQNHLSQILAIGAREAGTENWNDPPTGGFL